MTPTEPPAQPSLPFPIFQISRHIERFMLYDVDIITWLRQAHNILGVLIGTLPQSPQQNVFLGLPLELLPEEALLLVRKGLAFIVNDLNWHKRDLASKNANQVESIRANAYKKGLDVAMVYRKSKQTRTHQALQGNRSQEYRVEDKGSNATSTSETANDTSEDSLFGEPSNRKSSLTPVSSYPQANDSGLIPWTNTPTTSYPPLAPPAPDQSQVLPNVDVSSYALFEHLHELGYFISPGIRFGCRFAVYPGDPLRFHSHFLSMSYDWDEEIDLLDLTGGGRLGTGVKKGWLIGGPKAPNERRGNDENEGNVRTFCIEWGGM